MASIVGICNVALTDLGANTIVSLEPPAGEVATVEQKTCQAHYEPSRDVVLEDGDWSFAIAQRILPASAETAPFGQATMFMLPAACIRVIRVSQTSMDGNEIPWRLQKRYIYAQASNLYITYIERITDPVMFSPRFADCVSSLMAAAMAIPLTQNRTLRNENLDIYQAKLDKARANDGMQGKMQEVRTSRLRRARWQSGTGRIG